MRNEANVITAMHAVCAAGVGTSAIVQAMMAGTSGLRPCEHLHPENLDATIHAGAITDETWQQIEKEHPQTNRPTALGLHVGEQVLQQNPPTDAARTGLVVCTTKAEIDTLFHTARQNPRQPTDAVGEPAKLLEQLTKTLAVDGPCMLVSNACASGLLGLMQADRWLRRGWCDRVLVVAVDVLSEFVVSGFASLAALGSGPCRPFDADRDGISLGEAGATVLLEPHTTTAMPLATLKGYAHTSDGFHLTAPARGGIHLAHAIEQALHHANLTTDQLHYVNAHGTGTPYNDEAEAHAIAATVGCETPVTSMKAYFGHTLGAAGLLEAALCIEMMQTGCVPASLGCQTPGVPVPIRLLQSPATLSLKHVLTLKTGFGGLNAATILGNPNT